MFERNQKNDKDSIRKAVIAQSISTAAAAAYGLAVLMVSEHDKLDVAVFGGVLVFLISVPTIVLTLLLHYRCWSAVPFDRARTTPGKAVGLLFIPFFNFYWLFESFAGLAEDLAGKREHAPGRGLGIALGILSITLLFPAFADVLLVSEPPLATTVGVSRTFDPTLYDPTPVGRQPNMVLVYGFPVLSAPLDIVWFVIWLLYAMEMTAQANRRMTEAEAAAGVAAAPT